MAGVDAGAGEDVVLDRFKEADEAATDDVADVNEEGADDEAEVDDDDGNDEAREDTLDAIIVEADASKLGIDDDEDEDDEDDVGEVAHILPDTVDGGVGIRGDGIDFELFADETIEGVDDEGDSVGDGADNPGKRASLFLTGVGFGGAVRGGGAIVGVVGGGVVRGARTVGVLGAIGVVGGGVVSSFGVGIDLGGGLRNGGNRGGEER